MVFLKFYKTQIFLGIYVLLRSTNFLNDEDVSDKPNSLFAASLFYRIY